MVVSPFYALRSPSAMTLRDVLVRSFLSVHCQQFFGRQGHPFTSEPISTAQEESVAKIPLVHCPHSVLQ